MFVPAIVFWFFVYQEAICLGLGGGVLLEGEGADRRHSGDSCASTRHVNLNFSWLEADYRMDAFLPPSCTRRKCLMEFFAVAVCNMFRVKVELLAAMAGEQSVSRCKTDLYGGRLCKFKFQVIHLR